MPKLLNCLAVSIIWISDSALQGPAMTHGFGSVNMPHSDNGAISNLFSIVMCVIVYNFIWQILRFAQDDKEGPDDGQRIMRFMRLASSISDLTDASSSSAMAFRNRFTCSM